MKFLISCCGVTLTAHTSSRDDDSHLSESPPRKRPTISSSSSPARGRSSVASSSPARGRTSSSSSPSYTSSSSVQRRSTVKAPTPRGYSNPRVIPMSRQTRSELGFEQAARPQRAPRRRSGRPEGSAASALHYSEWTPSLCPIAEDNVYVARRPVQDRKASIEQAVSQKSGRDKPRARSRSHNDDHGRVSVTVIPAFAPTPFMF